MKYNDFEIHAIPFISNAYCKKCRNKLIEVDNGWLSKAMFCPKCNNVYTLKLIKVPDKNVSKGFLRQAELEANRSVQQTRGKPGR